VTFGRVVVRCFGFSVRYNDHTADSCRWSQSIYVFHAGPRYRSCYGNRIFRLCSHAITPTG